MLNFLGIGAQKSGTTWLHTNLAKHPFIHFPPQKEVHFWDKREERDLSIDWYKSLFPNHPGSELNGEITPAYALLPTYVIQEIHGLFPDLQLIYMVRDPLERAWSSALMALRRAEMTMEDASDAWFIDHFKSAGSMGRGDYEGCIQRWLSIYKPEQLLILDYNQIATAPRALLCRCSRFLGIDPGFYERMPMEALQEKVYANPDPQPLRPSLRPVLEELYKDRLPFYHSLLTKIQVSDNDG